MAESESKSHDVAIDTPVVDPVVTPAPIPVAAKPAPAVKTADTPPAKVKPPVAKSAVKPKPILVAAPASRATTPKPAPAKRVVKSTPTPAAPVRTAPVKKDAKMTIDTKFAPLNGLNDHAKGAIEKGTQLFEEMNAFGKGNIEALVESSKIAAKGIETLGQDAAERAKKSFEGMTEAAKTLAAAKSPTEFMKLHGDYARTAFDSMIADSSRSTEMLLKMFGEIAQPISKDRKSVV